MSDQTEAAEALDYYVSRAFALSAQNAELIAARDAALRECATYARQAGLAQGKLDGSELAGVVEGWRERAEAAEAQLAELQARAERAEAERDDWRDTAFLYCDRSLLCAENASLRQALAAATGALEPFAKAAAALHSGYDDGIAAGDRPMVRVFVSDLRAAALAAGPAQPLGGGEHAG